MEYDFLGPSGLRVLAIALGGWLTYGGHVVEAQTHACLKTAFAAGISFFDCGKGYLNGDSERVMGKALKEFPWSRCILSSVPK